MLKQNKLPHKLWDVVIYTLAYVLNRCPTKSLQNKVLEEVWSGTKPNASQLKEFGLLG